MSEGEEISRRAQFRALLRVVKYRPAFTAAIIGGSVFAAMLEGVGLSFILPIIELVQASGDPTANVDGVMLAFVMAYQSLGVPFTLGYIIAGVSAILAIRWTSTFVVRWLRDALVVDYTREIQKQSFDNALDARIAYFDREGSDDILNAIVTQSEYAGRTIRYVINLAEQFLLSLMYLGVALFLAPVLTLSAIVVLGGFSVLFRYVLEPGYALGDEVADANERVQQAAQAGTQGIRDTKVFGLREEHFGDFLDAVDQFAESSIKLRRNEQAIQNFYNLLTAVSIFVLIFLALTYANMSLGALGVFLFAMFRLGPKASSMNTQLYRVENNLPHLVRAQDFIDELAQNTEPHADTEPVPAEVQTVEFNNVHFSYTDEEKVLRGIDFEVAKGEFIGFVGQSGAGKSTIVSLLARMYEVDDGEIRANGVPIDEMDIRDWRDRLSIVRQNPYIFNDTLRYNLTIGNRDVGQKELNRVCRIAKVDEFKEDLPQGYDTLLGDDGVRLSGGQKQRVALARALIEDAELLILDEATSDLDSNLEKQVQRAIEEMERNYTVITIAHRLSTVRNADCIYTVENGKIAESGSHGELVDRDGKYAELYEIQVGQNPL